MVAGISRFFFARSAATKIVEALAPIMLLISAAYLRGQSQLVVVDDLAAALRGFVLHLGCAIAALLLLVSAEPTCSESFNGGGSRSGSWRFHGSTNSIRSRFLDDGVGFLLVEPHFVAASDGFVTVSRINR